MFKHAVQRTCLAVMNYRLTRAKVSHDLLSSFNFARNRSRFRQKWIVIGCWPGRICQTRQLVDVLTVAPLEKLPTNLTCILAVNRLHISRAYRKLNIMDCGQSC